MTYTHVRVLYRVYTGTILFYFFNPSSMSVVEYTHCFRVLCFIEHAALRLVHVLDCSSNFYTKPAPVRGRRYG